MNIRSDWLYDIEREAASIYVGVDAFDCLNVDDRKMVTEYMRESAAKITRLLEDAEQNVQTEEVLV